MAVTDPHTRESFIPKRSNQKFASAKNRIKYNNNKANFLRKKKAFCDRPLHVNFKILEELMKEKDTATFHPEYLKGRGFTSLVTHIEKYNGISCFCVYNFLVINEGNQQVKIIRNG